MSELTNIQWCDATFNPWEGCTKISTGCLNCYAETRSKRFKHRNWGKGAPRWRTSARNWNKARGWNRRPAICTTCGAANDIETRRCNGVTWCNTCLTDTEYHRRRVFCASLADWLDDEVPIEWLADLLKLIHETPNLDWLLLTKRPENFRPRLYACKAHWSASSASGLGPILDWVSDWMEGVAPAHVWLGVSVENQEWAHSRVTRLLKIPARVRFLSVEPMLGPIVFDYCGEPGVCHTSDWSAKVLPSGIHWVIVGGESGPRARPCNVEWLRSIVGQCQAAGVRCFVKQLGSRPVCDKVADSIPLIGKKHPKGGDMAEWPEDLRVREFPELKPRMTRMNTDRINVL